METDRYKNKSTCTYVYVLLFPIQYVDFLYTIAIAQKWETSAASYSYYSLFAFFFSSFSREIRLLFFSRYRQFRVGTYATIRRGERYSGTHTGLSAALIEGRNASKLPFTTRDRFALLIPPPPSHPTYAKVWVYCIYMYVLLLSFSLDILSSRTTYS